MQLDTPNSDHQQNQEHQESSLKKLYKHKKALFILCF